MTELKEILQENGLPATGKKADLIRSIVDNVPAEQLTGLNRQNTYVLSGFGKKYLETHDDYVKLHTHSGWDISQAEYDAEKAVTPDAGFSDICWRIFNRRVTQVKEFEDCRNIYYHMYELMKEDGKNETALTMLLRVLYVDLSGMSNSHVSLYRNRIITKQELYQRIENDQLIAPAVVKQIGDLEEVFSDALLTNLFRWQLPFNLCSYQLFADIVHSIINGTYDEERYRRCMAMEYCNRLP